MKLNDTFFGSWKIDKRIGQGSYGSVYRLKKSGIGEDLYCAMKVIFVSEDDTNDEMLSELYNEISLMARLKGHSNIVSFEDCEIVKNENGGAEILIRMEYLQPVLRHEKEHPLTESDVVKLGIDMCSALEVCEHNNMLHRDIKPENIFISPNGDYKLGDFGIARTIENNCTSLSRKGTYAYMAPEVFNAEKYDMRADIYSLGIVLYRFLCGGLLPFVESADASASEREEAIRRRMKSEKIQSANDSELMKIILKACEFSPDNRYKSASEMKAALKCYSQKQEEKQSFITAVSENDAFMVFLKVLVALGAAGVVAMILMILL